eukprot:352770-Chlamydomonas_euryale.AAC.3
MREQRLWKERSAEGELHRRTAAGSAQAWDSGAGSRAGDYARVTRVGGGLPAPAIVGSCSHSAAEWPGPQAQTWSGRCPHVLVPTLRAFSQPPPMCRPLSSIDSRPHRNPHRLRTLGFCASGRAPGRR